MKKLINLGQLQAILMKDVLKEQWQYYPKKAMKFRVVSETDNEGVTTHYLTNTGRLDIEHYGELMYRLGMAVQRWNQSDSQSYERKRIYNEIHNTSY